MSIVLRPLESSRSNTPRAPAGSLEHGALLPMRVPLAIMRLCGIKCLGSCMCASGHVVCPRCVLLLRRSSYAIAVRRSQPIIVIAPGAHRVLWYECVCVLACVPECLCKCAHERWGICHHEPWQAHADGGRCITDKHSPGRRPEFRASNKRG